MESVTIIIRSVKERTELLCRQLLLEQGIPYNGIEIVREIPFSASLKKSFQTGIKKNCKWTLCIDADILPRRGSVKAMIDHAEAQKENVCEIQGFMLDKLFGGVRKGGFHLYRTSLLPKVLQHIPTEGTSIRPESYTLRRMAEEGYPRAVVPCLIGIHDDEQYNFDVYRKAFVHAVKHLDKADLLIAHWKKNADRDHDFKIALQAFSDSIKNTDELYINSNQELYKEMFAEAGFEEKEELDASSISLDDIEKRIERWQVHAKYYDYFPDSEGFDSTGKTILRKLKHSFEARGVGSTILLTLSRGFISLGEKLGSRIPE